MKVNWSHDRIRAWDKKKLRSRQKSKWKIRCFCILNVIDVLSLKGNAMYCYGNTLTHCCFRTSWRQDLRQDWRQITNRTQTKLSYLEYQLNITNKQTQAFCCVVYVWRYSDEGLMLETSVFESLNGGRFTSTQLIKPNYLVILPTDAAPQLL